MYLSNIAAAHKLAQRLAQRGYEGFTMHQPTDELTRPAAYTRELYIADLKDYQQRCLEGAKLIQEAAQRMLVNMGMSEEEAIALQEKITRQRQRKSVTRS